MASCGVLARTYPPCASAGILGTAIGFSFQSLANGFNLPTPAVRSLLSILLIPVNGFSTITFSPLISVLTTALKVLSMPSLMPSKILPFEENTALTFVHAVPNVFSNQSAMPLNGALIFASMPLNASLAPDHAFVVDA